MKEEFKKLFSNKFMYVAVSAIILIPTLYNLLFLNSMWDPYENLKNLPVAIVNQDKAVVYEGEEINIGEEFSAEIAKNDAMNFNLTSEEDADRGIKNGKYFMKITVPSDFSKNATSVLDEDRKKMSLIYETSQGRNYTASKMSKSAFNEIKTNLENEITKTYVEKVVDKFKNISDNLESASDGAKEISNGSGQLYDGSISLVAGSQSLQDGLSKLEDGSEKLENGVSDYTKGVDALSGGAYELNNGLSTLNEKTPILSKGVNDLNDGAQKFYGGISEYTTGIGSLKAGTERLNGGISELNRRMPELVEGNGKLREGANKFKVGMGEYENGVQKAYEAASKLDEGAKSLNDGVKEFGAGLDQLNAGINEIPNAMADLPSDEDLQNLTNYAEGLKLYEAALSQVENITLNSPEDLSLAKEKLEALKKQTKELQVASSQVANKVSGTVSTVNQSKENLGKIVEGSGELKKNYENIVEGSGHLAKGASDLSGGLGLLASKNQELDGAASQLSQGIEKMYESASKLSAAVDQLQNGSQELDQGASQLNKNSSRILNGAKDLETGIENLNGNLPEFENGVNKLYNGSTDLKNGSELLKSKNGEILSGIGSLKNGIASAEHGASELKAGENKLNDGLLEIKSGSDEMAMKLKEGSEKINTSVDGKDLPDRISNPVSIVHIDKDKVDSNGEAMAPYMLSVALFVGAIAANVIIDAYKPYKKPIRTGTWYLSKTAVMQMIAILQAVCVYLVLLRMGLSPVERTQTFFFIILISITFMSLVTLFNIVLGKAGAFLMLVFLIIQLSGSAGTYPVELSSDFYQKITGYLPMTYSIRALRNTISTGLAIDHYVAIFVAIFLISNVLIYLYYNRKVRTDNYSRIRFLPE